MADSDEVVNAAHQLHAKACVPDCPMPLSESWLNWARKIVAGQVTEQQAIEHITGTRRPPS